MYDQLQKYMPPPEKQHYTLGKLCQHLQLLPPAILELAQQAEVGPIYFLDGVPIFDGYAVGKLLELVSKTRAALDNAEQKASRFATN